MPIGKNRTGLAFGFFAGFLHIIWSVLVYLGLAKIILNFFLVIHFVSVPFTVLDFNLTRAVILIIAISASGYIFGWIFAFFWNFFHR